MKNKRIITVFTAVALSITGSAQQYEDNNYIGINFGGGLNSLVYDAANGDKNAGGGIETGLFFGHFFTDNIGLGVGLQYSLAHASAVYNYKETTTGLVHPSNPNLRFDLNTTYNNWKERQSVSILSIPVECLYRKPINDKWNFIGGLGLSLDMHVGGKYKAKDGSYTLSGTYPALGSYVVSDMPEHGFTTYDDVFGAKFDNKTGIGGSLIADAGVRTKLKDHWGLYMGLYFGYGFTNIIDESKSTPMLVINEKNPTQIDYAGSFNSQATDKLHTVRFGVKVAVDFGWNKGTKKVVEQKPAVDNEAERLAAEKAEAERLAKEKAEAERLAKQKAEEERLAAEKAAREKAAADSVAQAKIVAEQTKAEAENLLKNINATVYFGSGGSNITLDDKTNAAIQAICKAMNADRSLKIVIAGHTDNTGPLEANMKCGQKRAEALRDYMVKLGAPAENIECESKGPNEPIADNKTAAGRSKNRRASVTFK